MDNFSFMGAKPLLQDSPTVKLYELQDWQDIACKLNGFVREKQATQEGLSRIPPWRCSG